MLSAATTHGAMAVLSGATAAPCGAPEVPSRAAAAPCRATAVPSGTAEHRAERRQCRAEQRQRRVERRQRHAKRRQSSDSAVACAVGVGVVATLRSAAWLLLLLRPSPSLRRSFRRRALAGALGTGQCAAASCQVVVSVVGVVAASQRVEAQAGENGLGGRMWRSASAAGRPSAAGRQRVDRRLCVASCAGRTRPPPAVASTIRPYPPSLPEV